MTRVAATVIGQIIYDDQSFFLAHVIGFCGVFDKTIPYINRFLWCHRIVLFGVCQSFEYYAHTIDRRVGTDRHAHWIILTYKPITPLLPIDFLFTAYQSLGYIIGILHTQQSLRRKRNYVFWHIFRKNDVLSRWKMKRNFPRQSSEA